MAASSARDAERFRVLTSAIGRLALASSRYAWTTISIVVVVSMFLGIGVSRIHTNVDVADVLPRGDYNTTAAQQLTKEFKSAFTMQVTLQFHVDESRAKWQEDLQRKQPNRPSSSYDADSHRNITDEVYIRAVSQAVEFIQNDDELICCVIGVAELYKLINWTLEGGAEGNPPAEDSDWSLPDTSLAGELRYRTVHNAANTAILSAIDALSSPRWGDTAVLLMPAADEEASTAEIGRRAIAARDRYIDWARDNPDVAYQVFTGDNFPRLTVELPVANAHSSELTKEDFSRLLPLIAGFLLIMLFLAFRNVGAVLISFSSLAIGVLWTYGLEGYLGIALNPLNLTLLPLIMGVGIDYSIHVVNEFLEHKARGLKNENAFREVGRRAGLALFIGTITTIIGLLVMVVSPSLLIAQFGGLAAFAMAVIFTLSLTFIPAALTLWPTTDHMGASFKPSRFIAAIARLVTKGRFVVVAGVLLLSAIGTVASANLYNEAFGDPGRNYLRSDPIRQEHEQGLKWFYDVSEPDVKANVITFEGDLTNPEAHRYMRVLEAQLKKQPLVIADTLRTIPFLVETWLTVKGGATGAADYIAKQRTARVEYPDTREEIKAELDGLYASPVAALGSIFTNGPNGDYTLGVMTFSARAATFASAKEVWGQVWSAIGNASRFKPDDIQVAFVGNTATNYLFVEKEVPWVLYMSAAATVGLMLMVIPFFRSFRAVAAVGLVSFATTAWWLGLLPQLDIGMAITLVIPTIFIISLGTDYTVHLIWSFLKTGHVRGVFETTGKAILFSWMTTVGPFVIFTLIQDLSVRKTMIATALAITIIFVVTVLVVPSFYPVERRAKPARIPRDVSETG